jgi:hypothetical protein
MSVKHVHAGKFVTELDDPALALAKIDRVGLLGRAEARARGIEIEHVGVKVEIVHQVELGHVREINAHLFADFDRNRMLGVVIGVAIDSVEIVFHVEVHVQPVHHHDHLGGRRARRRRIDDERAIEPARNVFAQRHHVAVIGEDAERLGREIVGESRAARHDLENAIHVGRMDAVKVNGVRFRSAIFKMDDDAVTLRRAERRPRHVAVVHPCRKFDSRGYFQLLVFRPHVIFALGTAVGQFRFFAVSERGQKFHRVHRGRLGRFRKSCRARFVRDRNHLVAHPARLADGKFAVEFLRQALHAGRGLGREPGQAHRPGRSEHAGPEEIAPRERSHFHGVENRFPTNNRRKQNKSI